MLIITISRSTSNGLSQVTEYASCLKDFGNWLENRSVTTSRIRNFNQINIKLIEENGFILNSVYIIRDVADDRLVSR